MSVLAPPFDAARDHWRGGEGVIVLEYGDYECPYSRQAFRSIEQLQVINTELINVLEGRESDIKGFLDELDTFLGGLDAQKGQIVRALTPADVGVPA